MNYLPWNYELAKFELGKTPDDKKGYIPDFYLPTLGVWLEVKPSSFEFDSRHFQFGYLMTNSFVVAKGEPLDCITYTFEENEFYMDSKTKNIQFVDSILATYALGEIPRNIPIHVIRQAFKKHSYGFDFNDTTPEADWREGGAKGVSQNEVVESILEIWFKEQFGRFPRYHEKDLNSCDNCGYCEITEEGICSVCGCQNDV